MTSNSQDGISIRVMTPKDYESVKSILQNDFFGAEPLSEFCGKDFYFKNKEVMDEWMLSMIEQDMCLLALDENDGWRPVGCVLSGIQTPEDIEKHSRTTETSEGSALRKINILFNKIESESNIFEVYGISKALISHVTAVTASKRGKGLGARLAAALMDLGRSKVLPVMVANCTSYYSARQKKALGMKCIYSLNYADFKDDQGTVIFKPSAPHTTARVMAIKL
ncbi:arylalkylamine N-acetyltransferase-like 2 [Drosophila ficusphila]|uniref:arylalkylamine N-acetyltransferase-like 2 n=1 Tax=Drosophila ficusphila TaxID=30025 RepID=UPI0007E88FA9|nr:arylalkylamine N-acetyltransferase-like 2 [Drosophila ficusphila]